jgi:hypothetical protein
MSGINPTAFKLSIIGFMVLVAAIDMAVQGAWSDLVVKIAL